MQKTLNISLITLIILFAVAGSISYAKAETNNQNQNNHKETKLLNAEENQFENKDKFQFRIHDEKNTFMVKGIIDTYSPSLIEIDSKQINIDTSVTGEVKIVGTPTKGSYAIVQGIVENESTLYAEKIVINERNKKDIENKDNNNEENDNDDITPTPTITITPTPTLTATESAGMQFEYTKDLGNLIERVKNFLNYLVNIASTI